MCALSLQSVLVPCDGVPPCDHWGGDCEIDDIYLLLPSLLLFVLPCRVMKLWNADNTVSEVIVRPRNHPTDRAFIYDSSPLKDMSHSCKACVTFLGRRHVGSKMVAISARALHCVAQFFVRELRETSACGADKDHLGELRALLSTLIEHVNACTPFAFMIFHDCSCRSNMASLTCREDSLSHSCETLTALQGKD